MLMTVSFSVLHSSYNFCYANSSYFARVEKDNVSFFSEATENSQVLFILPKTYFVELLGKQNDNFYYCKYIDIFGYVKTSDVKVISGNPIMAYAENLSLRVFTPGGANVRSSPFTNLGATNLLITAGYLDTNFVFYNFCYGEEAIPRKGNVWYYCKYINNNSTYFGYVYSPFCDVSPIEENTEVVEYLQGEPVFDSKTTPTDGSEFESLNPTLKTILIIVCCLPCFVIIYLLAKPTALVKNASGESQAKPLKKGKKQKIHRLKHSDYYEIDDDFYN